MRANPPPLPPPIGNLGPGADVVVGVEREGVGCFSVNTVSHYVINALEPSLEPGYRHRSTLIRMG